MLELLWAEEPTNSNSDLKSRLSYQSNTTQIGTQ